MQENLNAVNQSVSNIKVTIGNDKLVNRTGDQISISEGIDEGPLAEGCSASLCLDCYADPAALSEKNRKRGETGGDSQREISPAGSNLTDPHLNVSNAQFITQVFGAVPAQASALVCTKPLNPDENAWMSLKAGLVEDLCSTANNNYVNASSFYPDENGFFHARKTAFAACHAIMLDDLGTKIPMESIEGLPISWLIETSPGNHQAGLILDPPLRDPETATNLLKALIGAGMCDPGSHGATSRWMRLPVAINGKPKHASNGRAFKCRLRRWDPTSRYTPDEVLGKLKTRSSAPNSKSTDANPKQSTCVDDAQITDLSFQMKIGGGTVLAALREKGYYKKSLGVGKHEVTCPWVEEHTDALDSGAAYFEPSTKFPTGGFCCQHSHRDQYKLSALLQHLGLRPNKIRDRPTIEVIAGELSGVVDAAERALADGGRHYNFGGLIASIERDAQTALPKIVPMTVPSLTKALSEAAIWLQPARNNMLLPCDPPHRHVGVLYDMQSFSYLPVLKGLAHQPHFRETDGQLVCSSGYDAISGRYGTFNPEDFVLPEPSIDTARVAMKELEQLLQGFHFATEADRAAAFAAIFTAVTRPSLPLAPGFHVKASVFASGKTYLCDLIGAFAGPGFNLKATYPASAEEATKSMLSMLLAGPAVIEFDDMDSDWIPYSAIKKMLTGEEIGERILGVSKIARVSTRTLLLGSGNNVGPVRDMRRRVLTINIDAKCETPATLQYGSDPLTEVRRNRAHYVSLVLTVILGWQAAGCPKTHDSFATFGSAWSDYARHPLAWLGFQDPATNLLEQIRHDPDANDLANLMTEWERQFGNSYVTVRKAVNEALSQSGLHDAICDLPVTDGEQINSKKLGWWLRKNANRMVAGRCFKAGTSDGRTGWAVIEDFERTHALSSDDEHLASSRSSEALVQIDF